MGVYSFQTTRYELFIIIIIIVIITITIIIAKF